MALPNIKLNITNIIHGAAEDGNLLYKYQPFKNLRMVEPSGETGLTSLDLSTSDANIDVTKQLQIDTETSYDDSINLLINDTNNPLKIVNSRFYLTSSTTYKVSDRRGNLDTNIYSSDNFEVETKLIKSVRTIISTDFLGIEDGGRCSVGSYNFYFKLADADGNESDFITESSKIVCHIGDINRPRSIRGGQINEDSKKIIKLRLNNLDLAYDYINIYYTRSSGDGASSFTKAYKITDKFLISNVNTEFSITGYENEVEIDISEINIQYASFESVKTNENCQNITFAGNITNNYDIFRTLEKYSLLVTPNLVTDSATIGNLSGDYNESYPSDDGYEYYNSKNIYYKLGYWNEDIYRFGIVYILNDYTLSPVFNVRGIKELYEGVQFTEFNVEDTINFTNNYIIEGSDGIENSKGVVKIDSKNNVMFNKNDQIKPIGVNFEFSGNVLEGNEIKGLPGLKDITRGFFFVRQQRIPTILAQGIGIGTSSKSFTPVVYGSVTENGLTVSNWFSESFLNDKEEEDKPKLGRNVFIATDVENNALLCPEASLRKDIFNSLFNSSEYLLKKFTYTSSGVFKDVLGTRKLYELGNLSISGGSDYNINTNLLLIEPGIELIQNENERFSSQAGISTNAVKHLDCNLGDVEDPENGGTDNEWNESVSKLRGEFNTFVGCTQYVSHGQYYNIFQKGYSFDDKWSEYFRIRYNDSSPFNAISERYSWESLESSKDTEVMFRGDCYISTYSHRVNWNFIDPDLPTNNKIIDPYTWYKNFRVESTKIKVKQNTDIGGKIFKVIVDDTSGSWTSTADSELTYRKILDLFTYKTVEDQEDSADIDSVSGLVKPDGKKYGKYVDQNGEFGASKLTRPDINAVGLGHWLTFKICSNVNLAMRDLNLSLPEEEAIHNKKRGFYPYQFAESDNSLPESNVINSGISKTLSDKKYFEIPDVPFIKTSFTNRIHYSDILLESSFKNGNRVFRANNYQDYTNEYGAIVKLVEWFGTLIVVLESGVIQIPVNERAMAANSSGENVYINTDNVLPKNPKVLSNTFGSLWESSVIKTSKYIYGIDTIGKKIWRTNGETFETMSDMKIQRFLNDNINLQSSDKDTLLGEDFITTHYNAFKHDVLFIVNYNEDKWNLCWNELTEKWTTRYSWFPEFSENINNIFYTFASKKNHLGKENILYKHGFAGNEEEQGEILPTKWYDEQEPFEFEFVVIGPQGVQKIFNNLKIISNSAEPESFYYEIVGDGYNWQLYKSVLSWIGKNSSDSTEMDSLYGTILRNDLGTLKMLYEDFPFEEDDSFRFIKLPYMSNLWRDDFVFDRNSNEYSDIYVEQDTKNKKDSVRIYQKGSNLKTEGRLKGNMHYAEDLWDVQIQPVSFKYAYLKDNAVATSDKITESKIRDKYIKVRVKYDGSDYAIITALKTFLTVSYS